MSAHSILSDRKKSKRYRFLRHFDESNMELSQKQRKNILKWIPLYLEKDILVSMGQFIDFIMNDQPELFCHYIEISVLYKDNIEKWIHILEKEFFAVNIVGEYIYPRLERWRMVNLLALRALMNMPVLLRCPRAFNDLRSKIIARNNISESLKFCIPDDSFFETFSLMIYEFPMRSRKLLLSTSLYPFRFSQDAIEYLSTDVDDKKIHLKSFDIDCFASP